MGNSSVGYVAHIVELWHPCAKRVDPRCPISIVSQSYCTLVPLCPVRMGLGHKGLRHKEKTSTLGVQVSLCPSPIVYQSPMFNPNPIPQLN